MSEDILSCSCPDPELCRRLRRHIRGRLWEIWNGINIAADKAEAYRELWRRQAAEELPGTGFIGEDRSRSRAACRHLGAETGQRECASCGGRVRIKVFACRHPRHGETTLSECLRCADYDAGTGET